MTSTVGTVQPKVPNFRDLSTTLLRMRMDFEQQEKQFLDEVDDLNTFDVVLRKAQDKVIKTIFCLSTKFFISPETKFYCMRPKNFWQNFRFIALQKLKSFNFFS